MVAVEASAARYVLHNGHRIPVAKCDIIPITHTPAIPGSRAILFKLSRQRVSVPASDKR